MSDESMEVEAVETEVQEAVVDKEQPEAVEEVETAETKEPSETVEDVKEKTEEKKEPTEAEKKAYALEKRVARQTAQAKQLQETLMERQKEIEELQSKIPQNVDDTPKEDDFDTFESWQEAVVEHKANKLLEQKQLEEKKQQLAKAQAEQQQKAAKQFEEAELTFKADNPEYDDNAKKFMEYANDLATTKGNNPTVAGIGQFLREVEGAPAIINHLGQNEDFVYELAEMSPINALIKMVEVKQSLESKAPEAENIKPAPIRPLKGAGKPNKSGREMSGDEIAKRLGFN